MAEARPFYLGMALGIMLRGYRRCLRWSVIGAENLLRPSILAVWHGRLLGVLLERAGSGMVTMASLSSDGALAAGAVRALGCDAVRGSASRGGAKALRNLKKALVGGAPFAGLTVDGPKGPWRRVKPGVLAAARWLDIPIIPATFSAKRVRLLRSWDRMVVPKFGTQVVVAYGTPLWVKGLPEDLGRACEAVGQALDELTNRMDTAVYGHPLWPPEPR